MRSRDSEYVVYRDSYSSERRVVNPIEEVFVVVILMAIAAAIRYWRLGAWSFWADEVFSVQDAQKVPEELPVNPVIYMIINFFINILGRSEQSARLGPYIISILSVPVLYWFGKKVFSPKAGMIACAFLVIHPWHIFWSQNARAYSLAFFLTGLSAGLFYLALERDNAGFMVLSLFTTLLCIFSHAQAVMLLPAFFAYIIVLAILPISVPKGLNEKNILTYFVPFAIGLMLLLLPSVRDYLSSGWGSNQFGRSPIYIIFTLAYSLGIPITAAAFLGGIHSLAYLNRGGLFLICCAIVPLSLLMIISPFFNVRGYYLFFTMPVYLLLAAFCASELMNSASRKSRLLSASVMFIILVALLSQSYLYFMVENGGRPKWREAFQSLNGKIKPDDVLVVSIPRIAEYYLQEPAQITQLEEVIKQLEQTKNSWHTQNQNVWFVLDQLSVKVLGSDRESQDSSARFQEWLYSNCRMVEEFPVYARVADRTISIWHLEQTRVPVTPMIYDYGIVTDTPSETSTDVEAVDEQNP